MDTSSIKSKIASLEEDIIEYQKCIEDLRGIESTLQTKTLSFDCEVNSKISSYDISCDNTWAGKRCEDALSQLEIHKQALNNLCCDLETLNQDIVNAIVKYEEMISSCEEMIRNLYEELEINLE